MNTCTTQIINENVIEEALKKKLHNSSNKGNNLESKQVRDILDKSLELVGLSLDDVAVLTNVENPALLEEIFVTANQVKQKIYGNRIVIFAPLYISNLCSNNCLYCAFRSTNTKLKRKALTKEEITEETRQLLDQGQKGVLLVAGESYPHGEVQYVFDAINTIYTAKNSNGHSIRRINVNIAPLSLNEFKELKQTNIGTYQLFQETYHKDTYKKVHAGGKKMDYDWRLLAMDRALLAGIDDVGIGALFGLTDWRFDLLALLVHSQYLKSTFGVGPHTISVPRIELASGSEMSIAPPKPVSDLDFCKIVAILRLAVPYTGIIMSTRESAILRRTTLALGVSQISAGSRTNPGGYSDAHNSMDGLNVEVVSGANKSLGLSFDSSQFSLSDHRSLDEIVADLVKLGYIPSFCTACYRSGRTGEKFMCIAAPGHIKNMCAPNAPTTFLEYLIDYATPTTRIAGERLINETLAQFDLQLYKTTERLLAKIKNGERDVYI